MALALALAVYIHRLRWLVDICTLTLYPNIYITYNCSLVHRSIFTNPNQYGCLGKGEAKNNKHKMEEDISGFI